MIQAVRVMSLRAAVRVLWLRSNLLVILEVAHLHWRAAQVSGEEQECPRNDISKRPG